MGYDDNVPENLLMIQRWFADKITQDMELKINDAAIHIAETKVLSANERMHLYNQSYWLRLLDALYEEYPLLSRLFGKQAFSDEIAIPYLRVHPPSDWSLNSLGSKLFPYLQKHYVHKDRALVVLACELDWACQKCFFAKRLEPLTLSPETAEKILDLPLRLQPYVYLVKASCHIMNFREALLEHNHDYWLEHAFPKLEKDKNFYFILFRKNNDLVAWDTLAHDEYLLLQFIQQGININCVLRYVDPSEEIVKWINKWLACNWLTAQ